MHGHVQDDVQPEVSSEGWRAGSKALRAECWNRTIITLDLKELKVGLRAV